LSSLGPLWSRQDSRGHVPATVRDREALGAIPGPWRRLTEWPVRQLDSCVAGFAPVLMPRPEDLL